MQKTDTPCKNCIFAEWDGITQTGCKLGRIDMYRKAGVNVIEAYDEEKEFFVIDGHRCMYARTAAWAEKNVNNKASWENLLEKEVQFKYQALVIVDDNINHLLKTLDSLWDQKVKPQHVTVIRPYKHIKDIKMEWIRPQMEKSGVRWRVETIVDPNWSHRDMIDLVIPFVKFPFYSVFKAGIKVPLNTFSTISDKINNEMLSFMHVLTRLA